MGKNYEEYIAELETELSDAKQSNASLRDRVNSQDAELQRERDHSERLAKVLKAQFTDKQDAITAWSMGFE